MSKKRLKNVLIFVMLILFTVFFVYFGQENTVSSKSTSKNALIFDTIVTISIYGQDSESNAALINNCLDLCRYYEKIFSRTNPDSELYQLNQSNGGVVSEQLSEVIASAMHYCRLTDGRFDITMGALSDMYGFSSENPKVPSQDDIDAALSHVDYRNISIENSTATISDPDTVIDLGAIAKGYIADRVKDYLVENGVTSAIINLGGNVLCIGGKPDGNDFTIDIQYPFETEFRPIVTVAVSDLSVVTSGIYERCFTENDVLYHHILNPKTGYPYENDILSVSIIGPESETCDALSTVTYVLGLEEGLNLINKTDDYYAVFVTKDYEVHYSDGFQKKFVK